MMKCSVCGKEMTEHKGEDGRVYAVQMCGVDCMGTAWSIVTSALKQGKRPKWYEERKGRTFRMTAKEKQEVKRLYSEGMSITDISRRVGRNYNTVKSIVYKE